MDGGARLIKKNVLIAKRFITEEGSAIVAAAKGTWVCKQHQSYRHDLFLSYRVQTEKALALTLCMALNKMNRNDGKQIRAFLDAFCLNDGENWQDGFLNGLASSKVIILLISNESIKAIKGAHEKQDNVLLEYEYALSIMGAKGSNSIKLFPIFVGTNEELMRPDGTKVWAYVKFTFPNIDDFPDQPHRSSHPPSGYNKTIRETMRAIFALQGQFLNPEERLDIIYNDLLRLVNY